MPLKEFMYYFLLICFLLIMAGAIRHAAYASEDDPINRANIICQRHTDELFRYEEGWEDCAVIVNEWAKTELAKRQLEKQGADLRDQAFVKRLADKLKRKK